jgi:hypothetical protein
MLHIRLFFGLKKMNNGIFSLSSDNHASRAEWFRVDGISLPGQTEDQMARVAAILPFVSGVTNWGASIWSTLEIQNAKSVHWQRQSSQLS